MPASSYCVVSLLSIYYIRSTHYIIYRKLKMSNTYSVIVFTEDNTVEAVPTSWVKKKDGTCAWPTTKSRSLIMKLIEKKSVPNEIQFKYYKAKVMKTCESLTNARKMAEKGETKTDISSTDESDMLKKKKKPKLLLDCSDPSSSCPKYSASDDDSDSGMKLTSLKSHRLLNGWSPSPSKIKFKCQSDPQEKIKYFDANKKKSAVRKISYSDSDRNENIASEITTTPSLLKNIDNSSIQPLNMELVELDKLLNNDDDDMMIDYSNDYITINADDSGVLIQNTTAAAVTSVVTPSDKQSSTAKQLIMTNGKRELDLNVSPINPDTEFQKEVLYKLSFIKHELRRIVSNQMELGQRMENLETQNLSNILQTANNKENTYLQDIPGLPLNTISDLNAFNQKLSGDEIFCNNVRNQLTYIGGKHFKAMIKRIMAKLFTDELLKLFSYSGKKGKTKFSDQMICPIIFDAVKNQPKFKNVTQNEMEEVIKYVLAQAPFNIKRLQLIK